METVRAKFSYDIVLTSKHTSQMAVQQNFCFISG